VGLEVVSWAYPGSGEATEGEFVNEDESWRWVQVCVCDHAEFALRKEATGRSESSSSLVWHQSRHRPAISSCQEEGEVARGERAVSVEASLEPLAGRGGMVVWVGMMIH